MGQQAQPDPTSVAVCRSAWKKKHARRNFWELQKETTGELQKDNAELSARVLYACRSSPCSHFVKCVWVLKAAIRWVVTEASSPLNRDPALADPV